MASTPANTPGSNTSFVRDWPDDSTSLSSAAALTLPSPCPCFWSGAGGTFIIQSYRGNVRTITAPANVIMPFSCVNISTGAAGAFPCYS